jgi:hypothetical protein
VISQAAGSAYIEMNQTKVICGVYARRPLLFFELARQKLSAAGDGVVLSIYICRYGPRQTPKTVYSEKGKLNCFFKLATFAENGERRKYVSVRPSTIIIIIICLSTSPSLTLVI